MFKKTVYKANTPFKKGYKSKSLNSWKKKTSPNKIIKRSWGKTNKPSTFKWQPKPYNKQYSKNRSRFNRIKK